MGKEIFESKQDVHTLGAVVDYLSKKAESVEKQGRGDAARELRQVCYQLQDAIDDLLEDMKRHQDEINEYAVWEIVNEDDI